MQTDIRITMYFDITKASDKSDAIEKVKSGYKHLIDLWDRERMTSNIGYTDTLGGIDISMESFEDDIPVPDEEPI